MNPRFLFKQLDIVVTFIKVEIAEISWKILIYSLESLTKPKEVNSFVEEITFSS